MEPSNSPIDEAQKKEFYKEIFDQCLRDLQKKINFYSINSKHKKPKKENDYSGSMRSEYCKVQKNTSLPSTEYLQTKKFVEIEYSECLCGTGHWCEECLGEYDDFL